MGKQRESEWQVVGRGKRRHKELGVKQKEKKIAVIQKTKKKNKGLRQRLDERGRLRHSSNQI